MGLMDRVAMLVKSNLNDLVDRAEDPAKMMKQLVLDMENQMIQVKTQLAIDLADQHVLGGKLKENDAQVAAWRRKAELALDKGDEELARAALERSVSAEQIRQQFSEQAGEVNRTIQEFKTALGDLRRKIEEAQAKTEVLAARHRRARAAVRVGRAQRGTDAERGFAKMEAKVRATEAAGRAEVSLMTDDLENRLERLERDDRVEKLLEDLRRSRGLPPATR